MNTTNDRIQSTPPTLDHQHVDLTHQLLQQLPSDLIRAHPQMRSLDCSSNLISNFPIELIAFTYLHTLQLRWNKLTTLPTRIASLVSLTELDCSFNSLQGLPNELTQMRALKKLILHDNQLVTLPSEMNKMSSLTVLNCNYNQLSHLPPALHRCTNLTELSVLGNPLVTPNASCAYEGTQAILNALQKLDMISIELKSKKSTTIASSSAQSPSNSPAFSVSSASTKSTSLNRSGSNSSLRNSGRNQLVTISGTGIPIQRTPSNSNLQLPNIRSATPCDSAGTSTSISSTPSILGGSFSSPFTAPLLVNGHSQPSSSSSTAHANVRGGGHGPGVKSPTNSSSCSSSSSRVISPTNHSTTSNSSTNPLQRLLNQSTRTKPSSVRSTTSAQAIAAASLGNPVTASSASSASSMITSTLTSQIYPKSYHRKWLTERDEKELQSNRPPISPPSSVSSNPSRFALSSAHFNQSADIQRVRQLMIARGNLVSLGQLEDALELLHEQESTVPPEIDETELSVEDDAAANDLFYAEVAGRFPWLERSIDDVPLSPAATAYAKSLQPPPPVVPAFPSLTPELKSEIESTCSRSFLCSITCELMHNPVVASDGHTYEREAIERWLLKNNRSPLTNQQLPSKVLTPNHALRTMILEFVDEKLKSSAATPNGVIKSVPAPRLVGIELNPGPTNLQLSTSSIPSSDSSSYRPIIRPRSAAALNTIQQVLHHQINSKPDLPVATTGLGLHGQTVTSSLIRPSNKSIPISASLLTNPTIITPNSFASSTTVASSIGGPSATASYQHTPSSHASTSLLSPSRSIDGAVTTAKTVPHPNDLLIAQIEDQWREYSRSIPQHPHESKTSSSSTNRESASSLPVLLTQLQSNGLFNFFEFSHSRSILTIYGPSFDCLYYNPPPTTATSSSINPLPAAAVSTIYRDRTDYMHTLGNLSTLILKYVDWQLVRLQLPLIRQRMTKLKHLVLVANNIHSLYQLDDLALFASPSTGTSLDTVSITQNAVTHLHLYRPYVISLLTMNSWTITTGRHHAVGFQLDDVRVSESEMYEGGRLFHELHRQRHRLSDSNPPMTTSSTQLTGAHWLDQLYELSLNLNGGPAGLGTAANPLQSNTSAAASGPPSLSSLPLPIRPIAPSPHSRKSSKRLVEDLIQQSMNEANKLRNFDSSWDAVVMDQKEGMIQELIRQMKLNGSNVKSVPAPRLVGIELNPGPFALNKDIVTHVFTPSAQALFKDGLIMIYSFLSDRDWMTSLHTCSYWYHTACSSPSRRIDYYELKSNPSRRTHHSYVKSNVLSTSPISSTSRLNYHFTQLTDPFGTLKLSNLITLMSCLPHLVTIRSQLKRVFASELATIPFPIAWPTQLEQLNLNLKNLDYPNLLQSVCSIRTLKTLSLTSIRKRLIEFNPAQSFRELTNLTDLTIFAHDFGSDVLGLSLDETKFIYLPSTLNKFMFNHLPVMKYLYKFGSLPSLRQFDHVGTAELVPTGGLKLLFAFAPNLEVYQHFNLFAPDFSELLVFSQLHTIGLNTIIVRDVPIDFTHSHLQTNLHVLSQLPNLTTCHFSFSAEFCTLFERTVFEHLPHNIIELHLSTSQESDHFWSSLKFLRTHLMRLTIMSSLPVTVADIHVLGSFEVLEFLDLSLNGDHVQPFNDIKDYFHSHRIIPTLTYFHLKVHYADQYEFTWDRRIFSCDPFRQTDEPIEPFINARKTNSQTTVVTPSPFAQSPPTVSTTPYDFSFVPLNSNSTAITSTAASGLTSSPTQPLSSPFTPIPSSTTSSLPMPFNLVT